MPKQTIQQSPALTASQASWRCVQSRDREGWLDLMADDLVRSRLVAVTRALLANPDLAGADAAREWLAMRPGPLARTSDLVNRLRLATGGHLSLLALALRALSEAVRA